MSHNSPNLTCRLGSSLKDRIIIPELFSLYLKKKFGFKQDQLVQEMTSGMQGQLQYHTFVKAKVTLLDFYMTVAPILNECSI